MVIESVCALGARLAFFPILLNEMKRKKRGEIISAYALHAGLVEGTTAK